MTNLRFGTAFWLASVYLPHLAIAQQPGEKPKELGILGQYVGDWTSDVTSKPAVWTPQERKFRTSNHARFVLDGWFLHHIEVNREIDSPNKVGKSLFVWTFAPESQRYVEGFSNPRASLASGWAHGIQRTSR